MLENKSEIQCLRVVNGCNFCSIVFRFEGDEMKEKGGGGASIFISGKKSVKKFCSLMYYLFVPTGTRLEMDPRNTPWGEREEM